MNVIWPAIVHQCTFESAILDGEIAVWNKKVAAFEAFRTLAPVFGAAHRHAPAGTIIRYDGPFFGEGAPSTCAICLENPIVHGVRRLLLSACPEDDVDAATSALQSRATLTAPCTHFVGIGRSKGGCEMRAHEYAALHDQGHARYANV